MSRIIKRCLTTYCYAQRFMLLSALIKEDSFLQYTVITQRPTFNQGAMDKRYCVMLHTKWDIYSLPPSPGLKDHHTKAEQRL